MDYLLDTHTFIWFSEGDQQLSAIACDIIQNPENKIAVSTISIWEMAIKLNLGKLKLNQSLEELIVNAQRQHIEWLSPTLKPIVAIQNLPLHHRDPFDRMLIAQTAYHQLTIISRDVIFDSYGVPRVW